MCFGMLAGGEFGVGHGWWRQWGTNVYYPMGYEVNKNCMVGFIQLLKNISFYFQPSSEA